MDEAKENQSPAAALVHQLNTQVENQMTSVAPVGASYDPAVGASYSGAGDPVSRLEKLSLMKDKGLITMTEYDTKKAEIMAAM